MRNHDYKSDQKVLTFINSEECRSFRDFTDFLRINYLPLYERWAFYFFGKKNWINEKSITEMAYNGYTQYGCYIFSDIYHWKVYLMDNREKGERERIKIEINSKSAYSEEVSKIFCENAWGYVSDQYNNDVENQNDFLAKDLDYDTKTNYQDDSDKNYCEACDNSPCICSDKDRY